ncbi:hypothetical protein GN958_ATG12392 [Phytophthora infestans]|uniref:Uncharacterized protein n=1 Tax=Phytophthora infestans TaxID=4787 RepID=A0A8S9UCG9_PHYIN|nr:hypothetical protein GN958_ATG12392 [Phytophthora infestans]
MAAPPSVTVRPPAVTVSPPAVTVAPPLTTLKPPAVTVAPPALTLSPPAAMVVKPVASTLKTVVDVAVNLASINKKPVPSVSAAFKASTVLAKAVAELVSVSVAASVVLEMAAPPSVTVRPPAVTVSPPAVTVAPPTPLTLSHSGCDGVVKPVASTLKRR